MVVKNLPANAGDAGFIPGLGRSPGGGNVNPLQYSCLENSMDRGTWWTTVYGVAELDTTEHTILREKNDIIFLYHPIKINARHIKCLNMKGKAFRRTYRKYVCL